ncbi:MAG: hypothetical protein DMF38_11175 [Verrucomicrobia bacterium]|nr:MAG: hypothetical protein DMF38_11175 [Verrucomicrobiota bacterium]
MCGPHFCSMKITKDVHMHAAEQGITDEALVNRNAGRNAARQRQGRVSQGRTNVWLRARTLCRLGI